MEASILPSTQRFLATLPKIQLKHLSGQDTDCPICLEKYSPGPHAEHPVRLPCGHVFGSSCIRTWTSSSSSTKLLTTPPTCPLCRSVLLARPRSHIDRWELYAFLMQQEPYLSASQTLRPAAPADRDSATELVRLFYRVVLQILAHHRRRRIPASNLLLQSAQAVACRMGGLAMLLKGAMRRCGMPMPWGEGGPAVDLVLDPTLEWFFEETLERMLWAENGVVAELERDV